MPCDLLQYYCINFTKITEHTFTLRRLQMKTYLSSFSQSGSSLNAAFIYLHFMQLYYVDTVMMSLIDLNEILNESSYQR